MDQAAGPDDAAVVPREVRARCVVRATFQRTVRGTGRNQVHQGGGLRLLFPRSNGDRCEAVLVNTGGGIAGGDRWDLGFGLEPGARASLTSQSAERVYRAQRDPAVVTARIDLGAGADFEWLPQETILFDGARLQRVIEAEMAADASLTIVESIVFGRASMGEEVVSGGMHDRWRVRRAGKLVFAEDLRLDGDITKILDRPACGEGARALATILMVGPQAEARLAAVRAALDTACSAEPAIGHGASAWDGKLVGRLASASAGALRGAVGRFLTLVRGRPLPRVWPSVWQ